MSPPTQQLSNEELVLVVEALASAARVPYDSERCSQLVIRARNADAKDCRRVLERGVASRMGLSLTPVELPLTHVPRIVGPRQPVLIEGQEGAPEVAVVDADGHRLRFVSPRHPDGVWMGLSDLARELGLRSETEEVRTMTVEASAPMHDLSFPGKPAGDVSTALRRLWALLNTEREDIQAIVLYAVGAGVFTLTIPVAVQTLVNTVAFGTLLQPLVVMTILVIAGLALYGTLTALEVYVVELLQRRILARVVGDLSYRVPRARAAALDRIYGPEQLNRFFDVFTIHKAAAQLMIDGLDLVLRTSIGLVLLAFYHPLLLAFDFVLVLCLAGVLFGLGRGGMKTAIIESKKKYRLAGWLEELGRRPSLFKSPPATTLARDRSDAYLRDFLNARAEHFKVVMRQTIGALGVYALASGSLLGIGGYLVMIGQLTLGQLVAAELVLTAVVTAFAKMGKHVESFYDLVAAVDKVGMLFDLPVETGGGEGDPEPAPTRGSELRMERLSVDLGGRRVFHDVGVTVPSGEPVAFLGGSGSGKTVLADLLFGMRSPTSGVMRIDGIQVDDMPLPALRRRVAVARPDDIVQGTLLDNVRLGHPSGAEAGIRAALDMVELGPVIERLSDALQTELFPGGRPLTEAEAARLIIARAVASRPSLLVIDGLLDLQDEMVRARILERLGADDTPWTLIVLTRMESIARALPRCLQLEAGQTVDLSQVSPS
mgnify:CR=1 FL=1